MISPSDAGGSSGMVVRSAPERGESFSGSSSFLEDEDVEETFCSGSQNQLSSRAEGTEGGWVDVDGPACWSVWFAGSTYSNKSTYVSTVHLKKYANG